MSKTFNIKNLDQESKIKKHHMMEITNPILFSSKGVPTSDGLLSDEIFGVTPKSRSETFAYINLGTNFFHPAVFDQLLRYSNKFTNISSSLKKYKIINGELIEDENGNTGIEWLINNFNRIKFDEHSESRNKNILAKSLNNYKKFMNKLIVIPVFYRDIDTSKGFISVGEINRLYIEVLRLTKAIKDSEKFGLTLRDNIMYKMQLTLLNIYNYFMDDDYENSGDTVLGKEGSIYRTMLRKTIAYSSRLVMSQPDNNTNHWSEMNVTVDTTLVPLDSAIAQLFPFVIFELKNLIHNKYKDGDIVKCLDVNNKEVDVKIYGIEEYYNDEMLEKMTNRFVHSISNRFAPVYIPNDENKNVYMMFNYEDINGNLNPRKMTWTDLLYLSAVEAAEGKHMISTRYPLDTAYNQIVNKIKVGSTQETVCIKIKSKIYDNYPLINKDDINMNTENKFKEVCNISNASIKSMGADYDGDTANNKIAYSNEANLECEQFLNSKKRSININGTYIYDVDAESVLTGYVLTKCADESMLSVPKF